MPRIQIDLPERFAFSTEITLYLGHMNYAGHLDNALLLAVVSEARLRFFKSLGYTELDVEGLGIVVADVAVQYRSEAFHGEVMVVRMTASDFGSKGCDLLWCLAEKSTQREVARGKTGIVFFDYSARKVASVPENFRTRTAGGTFAVAALVEDRQAALTPADTREPVASADSGPALAIP
jgi:acyl-CoA thioester hydrolase